MDILLAHSFISTNISQTRSLEYQHNNHDLSITGLSKAVNHALENYQERICSSIRTEITSLLQNLNISHELEFIIALDPNAQKSITQVALKKY